MSAGGPRVPGSLKLFSCRYVHMCVHVYALGMIVLFMGVKSDRV